MYKVLRKIFEHAQKYYFSTLGLDDMRHIVVIFCTIWQIFHIDQLDILIKQYIRFQPVPGVHHQAIQLDKNM